MFPPFLLVFALFFLCISPISAQQLIIQLESAQKVEGQLYYALYHSAQSFQKEELALKKAVVPLQKLPLRIDLGQLPPGQYALAFFQDLNQNGQLDLNFWGIPKEPYGFSNDPKIVAGPPSFKAASFRLGPKENKLLLLRLKNE
ncbi:DUF2141 domain-containing protein [Saprospira sp. CCB-QB6]|uniref:DUF2141 domain-containing protein n=1 Tax=Saprospira sp. CCB-QB6 TaxID=3023936 RepID=UPI00234952B4|nr:DUF2141 domain-containing protein [Saprospira sp. CCB-QB6]WCL80354.1 DUF2141 domain-containing protein [Saprospira sp. CCB-QB6]